MPHIFVRGGKREMEIVDTITWTGSSVTTATLKIPTATIQPGDYMLSFIAARASVSSTPTTPTGWTLHLSQAFGNSKLLIYGKEYVAGDTDATVLQAVSNGLSATVALRAAKNSAPVDVMASNTGTVTGSSTTSTATTTVPNTLVIRALWLVNSLTNNPPIITWAGSLTPVEGVTQGLSGNSTALSIVAVKQPVAGSSGTLVATNTPASTSGVWATVAIAPQ